MDIDTKNVELANKNEIEGPINFVDVEIPHNILRTISSNGKLLEYLKSNKDLNESKIFNVDTDGKSGTFTFRGFVKERKTYTDEQENLLKNHVMVEKSLHNVGHDKTVKKDEPDQLFVTTMPELSARYAIPKKLDQVGYLLVYDNKDGLFDAYGKMENSNMTWLNWDITARDRLIKVIVLNPTSGVSRVKQGIINIEKKIFNRNNNS